MLKGTTRQGIWHVLMVVPNKSLLPSWATMVQATEMCSPAFPGAQLLWWATRQVPGSIGTSLHGRLKNALGFCGGQGYKQNRQVSPSGSQQLACKRLTDILHPGTPPHLSCPANKQVSVQSLRPQSHGLPSQQQGVLNACALQPRKAAKKRKDGDQESSRRILFVFACRMQAGALTRASSSSLVCLCDNVPFLRTSRKAARFKVQSNTPLCKGKFGW